MTLGFFFQAEDGIRDLVRSRGLGDVYKRQPHKIPATVLSRCQRFDFRRIPAPEIAGHLRHIVTCLLYTSDAADERSSVDLGGRRLINKKILLSQPRTQFSTTKTDNYCIMFFIANQRLH